MVLTKSAFGDLREIVYEQSGIRLQDGKETMVSTRLSKRLKALGIVTEDEYIGYLKSHLEEEIVPLLDVISTNVTSFFREVEHFHHLEKYLRTLADEGQTRFRIWSAASSTGQEPYTLAMTALESLRHLGASLDLRILATDISTRVLSHAKDGGYGEKSVEEIPPALRKKYFKVEDFGGTKGIRARDELRQVLTFTRLNLSTPPFPMKGPFDAIFVRNVMIYFDDVVRDRLVRECHRILRPGGLLFVGKSESLHTATDIFEREGPSIYKKIS